MPGTTSVGAVGGGQRRARSSSVFYVLDIVWQSRWIVLNLAGAAVVKRPGQSLKEQTAVICRFDDAEVVLECELMATSRTRRSVLFR